MSVVDSSGWLKFFARGKNASFFPPVVKVTDTLVLPTVRVYEVFKRLVTQRGEEGMRHNKHGVKNFNHSTHQTLIASRHSGFMPSIFLTAYSLHKRLLAIGGCTEVPINSNC